MDIKKEVESALEKIRPALQMDGGDVEVIEIDGTTVKVRLTGACHGCPMSQMTLQHGVEKVIKEAVPQIEKVEAVAE